jgi:putative acyl-CoA dehydrogenase
VLEQLAAETADLPGAPETVSLIAGILGSAQAEPQARLAVERIALLAAAAALRASAPPFVAEGFGRARLAGPHGATYGAAAVAPDLAAKIVDRALPG